MDRNKEIQEGLAQTFKNMLKKLEENRPEGMLKGEMTVFGSVFPTHGRANWQIDVETNMGKPTMMLQRILTQTRQYVLTVPSELGRKLGLGPYNSSSLPSEVYPPRNPMLKGISLSFATDLP